MNASGITIKTQESLSS